MRGTILFAFWFTLTLTCLARGEPPDGADFEHADARTWKETAAKAGLSDEAIEHLEHDKLVISPGHQKKVYDLYLSGNLPAFITSDSLLAAYHVLYEESFMRLERTQTERLVPILRTIWSHIDESERQLEGDRALINSAKLEARVIVGTALKLLGVDPEKPTAEEAKLIAAEVAKITAAEANEMPAWLGKPDATFQAIDYTRFKPRGFYTRTPRLEQFFRSVSWLEAIPLRPRHPQEFTCALLLASADPNEGEKTWESFFAPYEKLIGQADDGQLTDIQARNLLMRVPQDLEGKADAIEKSIRQLHGDPQINDQQQQDQPVDGSPPPELSIRIIPARRLADAVMFQRTTDSNELPRRFPDAVEVAALLGSDFALDRTAPIVREKLKKLIQEGGVLALGTASEDQLGELHAPLYLHYLQCLSTLLAEPEKEAPALFDSVAWKAKSCQTVLGSWSLQRHTLVLQAKENTGGLFGGPEKPPAGFVEPNPEFFSAMADLACRTHSLLKEFGALDPGLHEQATRLRNVANTIDKSDLRHKKWDVIKELPTEEQGPFWDAMVLMQAIGSIDPDDKEMASKIADLPSLLRKTADALDRGEIPNNAEVRKELAEGEEDLSELWLDFERLSRELESMAQRQLRGRDFTERDKRFFDEYGSRLQSLMLSHGGAKSNIDDAPRIVDVFAQPQANEFLEVGTGRPRSMYVLYRWDGKEVLCRGAAVPFYEFRNSQRLTDEQWIKMLDSPQRPALPDWSISLYENQGEPIKRDASDHQKN